MRSRPPSGPAARGLRRAAAYALIAAALAGCVDFSTDPNEILSIAFENLPSPSVVVGDTLRDATGAVAPLRAKAFNAKNEEVATVPVFFLSLDTSLVRVDSLTGYLIATAKTGTARIVANLAGLQSAPLNVDVIAEPDTVTHGTDFGVLEYTTDDPANSAANTTTDSAFVTVMQLDSTAQRVGLKSYLVSFAIEYKGVLQTDTLLAYPVNDLSRVSSVDTTTTSGAASRKIRLHPARLTKPIDTLVVIATVMRRPATHVLGSPVRFLLPVRPKP
jgi:hypothetical protein